VSNIGAIRISEYNEKRGILMVKKLRFADTEIEVLAMQVCDLPLSDVYEWCYCCFADSDGIYMEFGPLSGRVRVFPNDWIARFGSVLVKLDARVVQEYFDIV
jgi:hypothetical protein